MKSSFIRFSLVSIKIFGDPYTEIHMWEMVFMTVFVRNEDVSRFQIRGFGGIT